MSMTNQSNTMKDGLLQVAQEALGCCPVSLSRFVHELRQLVYNK